MVNPKKDFENTDHIDYLIITALTEERDAVLRRFGVSTQFPFDNGTIGDFFQIKSRRGIVLNVIVTLLPGMGNVDAGIHTSQVIANINPDYVLMVGIAGGIKDKVKRGDVLILDQAIYYSQAKQTLIKADIRPQYIPMDPSLLQTAKSLKDSDWVHLIDEKPPEESEAISAHYGPLLVGEEVIANPNYLAQLMPLHPKIIGVEMESYGVGRAVLYAINSPRFIAFRGVSDFADAGKDDSWHNYACAAVAAFTFGFILSQWPRGSTTKATNTPNKIITIRHLSQQAISKRSVDESLEPDYKSSQIIDIPIIQSNFFNNSLPIDLSEILSVQSSLAEKLNQLLVEFPNAEIAYFGIAHIPLLFYLGHTLTNKRKLRFFELDRYSTKWIPLQEAGDIADFKIDGLPEILLKDKGDVVLRISLSNTVSEEDVFPVVSSSLVSIHAHLSVPKRDSIVSETQLEHYGRIFRMTLDTIHELVPNRQTTHIFYAGPVSLAVYLGQMLHRGVDRNIIVYNYTPSHTPRYSWKLEVTQQTFKKG